MAVQDMIMPQLGESVAEGTILKWLKGPGDKVEADEMILEISTDKVDSEIPAPVSGVIQEVLFQEGDVVPVTTVIARIDTDGSGGAAAPAPAKKEEPVQPAPESPEPSSPPPVPEKAPAAAEGIPSRGKRFYSPLVRRLANENNVGFEELEQVPGSGANGRVTRKDFEQWLGQRGQGAPSAPSGSQAAAASGSVTYEPVNLGIKPGPNVNIVPMDKMRKSMAEHMVKSKKISPHVLSVHEVDVTHLVNWRNRHKASFKEQHGMNLTFTPMTFVAVVRALKEFPWVNASIDGHQVVEHKRINLGMAVALPDGGLIVPVIKDADEKNFLGMSRAVNDLATRARSKKLTPDDISGATFSVTNPGVFGTIIGFPIISQPNVAILGVNAIQKRPVVIEGDAIAVRSMMYLSLAYDHRIVDGMLAGQFLNKVCQYIEEFDVSSAP